MPLKILLDECVPQPLRKYIPDQTVLTVRKLGWSGTKNGALLQKMQAEGIQVLLTIDQSIEYQQNKLTLPIALVIMIAQSNRLEPPMPLIPQVMVALETIQQSEIVHIREQDSSQGVNYEE